MKRNSSKAKENADPNGREMVVQGTPFETWANPSQQKAQKEYATKIIHTYRAACDGLRMTVMHIREFGQSMLDAQAALKCDDKRLYAWVRGITGSQKSDSALNNWKRLAQRWSDAVEPRFTAAEKAGKVFTLQDALALIKGESRPGRKKKAASTEDTALNTSHLNGDTPAGSAKDATAKESEEEMPIPVSPPFDMPAKDRLASIYNDNGPAPTAIQLMNSLVIPSLKKVVQTGVESDQVPFLANAIKEAMALIDALKQKYAVS